jgi:hypothetical protein
MIAIRGSIAMAFFKRELSPVDRFEAALRDKRAARQKLGDRLGLAEHLLGEKRAAAERLAVAGAANAVLDRADADMRVVDDRVKTLRAAVAELDEQIVTTERALADVRAQRERDTAADAIEAMAAAIEQAAPRFDAGAAALVDSVTRGAASIPEVTAFSANVEAMRREVLSAADLICWELRSAAVRTRAGNANAASDPLSETEPSPGSDVERQLIYTLNPLLWREAGEVRRVPAFALVSLPRPLLAVALRHQHVDQLNARRVQTLMHVHGNGRSYGEPDPEDPRLVDLDVLAAEGDSSAEAHVA